MQTSEAVLSTTIFISIFVLGILFSLSKREKGERFFSLLDTQELKGLAITAIIFAHVGLYLVSDTTFLRPWSYFAGSGVDIFLFLSGYGLASSMFRKRQSVLEFYRKRVEKLFVPMWFVLGCAFVLSFLILGRVYSWQYVLQSFLGWFTSANAYQDINSPLWYVTFILLYYLVFPWVFSKRFPLLTAVLLLVLGFRFVEADISTFSKVISLYHTHFIAFPLGVAVAWFVEEAAIVHSFIGKISDKVKLLVSSSLLRQIFLVGILSALLYGMYYYGLNSGVGKGWRLESAYSLLVAFFAVLFVVLKQFRIKLFSAIGKYSYEIYLIHWPIGYYSRGLWGNLPTWLAMGLYLLAVYCLAVLLQKVTNPKPKTVVTK